MFGAYTYLADMLERSGGIAPAQVGWWLMGFGTVGLLGNNLASRLVDGHPVKANILFCLMLGAGAVSAVLFAGQLILFVASLVIWGVAHTALFPLGQIRVINAARSGKALAGTQYLCVQQRYCCRRDARRMDHRFQRNHCRHSCRQRPHRALCLCNSGS
ncbi:putative arabinose transporter [compost metagenome]